jgi:predicted nucleotidyltransferase
VTRSLAILNDAERRTLDAYVALLRERLGERLLSIRVYGSVARGEQWWKGMSIRSDLDLFVLVSEPLEASVEQELLDATYPLFLESGRQLGPQFRTPEQFAASPIRESIERDAFELVLPKRCR